MSNLDLFKQFAAKNNKPTNEGKTQAVIYTRVSTKDQADNNASLSTQKKYCEICAQKKGLNIVEYFGGTHESAKSDDRKEFQRMITYVKRHKDIASIIVYSYDRFSRTGSNAIKEELRKRGIEILSATQEVDTSTSAGKMQQDVFLLFSKFDNDLRREKSISGMQEKLRKGYVNGIVPFGYTNLNPGKGKVQKLVINEDGKLLKKAFEWKAKHDLTYQEITDRLKKFGWKKNYKQLSAYFRNPIYCGLITSSLIPGEVIEGKHPPLVSRETFLKVNNILARKNFGGKYNRDDENLPLKQFVVSDNCGTPLTGYIVRKKELYYYKNNRPGSKENRSAKKMHELFIQLLSQYQLSNEKYKAPLKEILYEVFVELHEESLKEMDALTIQLRKVETNLNTIEKRYVLGEIEKDLYDKYKGEFDKELIEIQNEIEKSDFKLSNLDLAVENALSMSLDLPSLWASGDLEERRRIQKMVFPDGIRYNRENDQYRTIRVNSLFLAISTMAGETEGNKKGTNPKNKDLSHLVQ